MVNIGSRYLLSMYVRFELAVIVAYLGGMVVAYVLARLFVFESSGQTVASEFRRFAMVNLVALGFVWGISIGFAQIIFPTIHFTWHAEDVAHIVGVLAPAIISFLGHRYYSFRRTEH